MTISNTLFLRNALLIDAVVSGAAGLLVAGGATRLAPFLDLPEPLLFWAGVALFPWVALLVVLARRSEIHRLLLIDVVGFNVLWAAASIGILVTGLVSPNLLGHAFVVAQAAAVALFAVLQGVGLQRGSAAASVHQP